LIWRYASSALTLPRPQLTLEEAGELIDYYRDRNKQAAESLQANDLIW
jgi:hypothetical protein